MTEDWNPISLQTLQTSSVKGCSLTIKQLDSSKGRSLGWGIQRHISQGSTAFREVAESGEDYGLVLMYAHYVCNACITYISRYTKGKREIIAFIL